MQFHLRFHKESLKLLLQSALQRKEVSHFLQDGKFGDTPNFAVMGG